MRSLPVAGRFYLEKVRRCTSETGVRNSVELRRSAHAKQRSKIWNLKAIEPKGQDHCLTLALVILVLLQY